jgi:hypothetical protein
MNAPFLKSVACFHYTDAAKYQVEVTDPYFVTGDNATEDSWT